MSDTKLSEIYKNNIKSILKNNFTYYFYLKTGKKKYY